MKRNIFHFLMALVVAFGIWTYVVTVVSPESESVFYDIPVVLNNETILLNKGFMVVSDESPKVTLQLRGNRSDLNDLKKSDITIVADLSKINEAGEQSLSCNISFAGSGTGNAFEIVNQNPKTITLQIAEWASKEVPVVVDLTGTLDLDYIPFEDELQLDREMITITGPKDTVDQITQACVQVNLTGRTESVSESYRYTLCDAAGAPVDASDIKTNAAEVSVMLKIQRVKEIQLLVDVIYGGGATQENTVITMDYLTIKVSGSDKLLDSFGDSLKLGTEDLSKMAEDTTKVYEIVLPEGIENLTGIRQVSVSYTFPDLAVKKLNISNFVVTGTPSGVLVDIAAKVVEVTVRGPADMLQRISEEDITLYIDLSAAQLGDNLYKAQVMINKEFNEVGAIGTYSVLVSLKDAQGGNG